MKSSKASVYLSVFLAVAVTAGISAYAASNYGTSSDPLITLSYLDEVLTPKLMNDFKTELDKTKEDLGGSGESFKVITLSNGQTLKASVGCEMLLRVGTAKVAASDSPGLVDVTDGGTINNGSALTANHLYMVSIEGNGVTATAATVRLMVRGSYTIS
ncbi:MAG: hypothetical protein FWG32_01805 [Oscillospiraceae bacterium]|nr:hypothetical protein [Oscillospiraceae bacterium]